MQNKSLTQDMPDGLLQATEFTDNVTVTIKRVVDDSTEDLLSFTGAHDIQDFFAQRGVALGITQSTNVIALRVLALELLKRSQSQVALGMNAAAQTGEYARKLHALASSLKRDDLLLCSFTVEKPLTL